MSVVHDYMRERVPYENWTRPTWEEFKKLKEQIEALDKRLGEPDCTDPEKEKYMADVEARLAKLEKDNEIKNLRYENDVLKAEVARLKALHPEPNTLCGDKILLTEVPNSGGTTGQCNIGAISGKITPFFNDFETPPNER